ncbi:MAG: hypothetical protein MUF33_08920 [Candidatus Nanopelagicales bacterium]|jgi:hypothetical protein|nr:hypothetical protein [Candidatus Nanopelagicales bacterium]MCU0298626.1 hypothetical protein [Candidatus Nanopelagicales bacterium]
MKILAASVALSVAAAGPALATSESATFSGLGPVKLRMTVEQALATGAMGANLAICPGEDTDFKPEFEARALWSRQGKLIAIQPSSTIRGIELGSSAASVRGAFPRGSFRGRDIFTNGRIWVVDKPGSSLQFVLKKGKVRRIALTTGFVSTGGEWTC